MSKKPTYEKLEQRVRELEKKDSEHKRVEKELLESEKKYRHLYETMTQGAVIQDSEGKIVEANQAACEILGLSMDQMLGKTAYDPRWKQIHENGTPYDPSEMPSNIALRTGKPVDEVFCGIYVPEKNEYRWILIGSAPQFKDGDTKPFITMTVFTDISERKQTESERENILRMLEILNAGTDLRELMRLLLGFMQEMSGCDAVGIRLRDGNDFPYYTTSGFSDDFIKAEMHLCVENLDGQLAMDDVGNPVLECMCGNIICGRFDPSKPFFTEGGSFISNCTTKLLANTSEADRQARTRNRCNAEGYESVLLVPLRTGEETFGLLQFNAYQERHFPSQFVSQIERLAGNVAIALAQRKAEDSLKQSLERLKGFDHHSTEGMYRIDITMPVPIDLNRNEMRDWINKHAVVGEVNDALSQMYGLKPREMIGRPATDFSPDYSERAMLVLDKDDFIIANEETEDIDKNGNPLYLIENYHGIVKNGHLHAIWGAQRDITKYKKIEAQLQQAKKIEAIGTLAGGIAHDFNNMLGIITGNISYALSQVDKNQELHEVLLDVQEGAKQAQKLTQQLLTFAKGGEPVKKVVPFNQLIKESAEFVSRGAKSKCKFNLANDLWVVEIDSGQIHQVISNLVINADQSMPNGGIINIQTENFEVKTKTNFQLETGQYVKFSIQDQGIGIQDKYIAHIFDPYFTTKQKGRGLGLATSYSIIKKHGGQITIYSEIGKGSVFHVYLPAAGKYVNKPEEAPKEQHTGQGKILVMDDQEPILKMAGRILNRMGYEVVFAKDGSEAIEKYRKAYEAGNRFDLVILDLTIPGGMGGAETITKLLKIHPEIKAVVSSGYFNDPIMSDYENYGFCGIIPKPYRQSQMAELLNKILSY